MNVRKAPTFDPSVDHTSSFFRLHNLDALPARGLPEVEFWKLFAKCGACGNYMTTRTIPYHVCASGQLLYLVYRSVDLNAENLLVCSSAFWGTTRHSTQYRQLKGTVLFDVPPWRSLCRTCCRCSREFFQGYVLCMWAVWSLHDWEDITEPSWWFRLGR